MNNCIILGFGRSGTSALGGLLYHSGYFAGNHLHPPRSTNPKGFYEDIIINRINEQLLEGSDYSKNNSSYPVFHKDFSPYHPSRGHRWLTFINPGTIISNTDEHIKEQIRDAINIKKPFAYKDPRFNYTLPVWSEYLPDNTRFICIFRNPATVVQSVILECNTMEYLNDFYIDEELAFQLWYNSYRHLLDTMTPEIRTRMLFISYEGLIQKKFLDKISILLGTKISEAFIEPALNRTNSVGSIPVNVGELYNELKKLMAP